MKVSREQLYAAVWAEPMTAVAAKYDVSSSYLARVCAQLNVPKPDRGYWAKLKAGKATKPRAALPELPRGSENEWEPGTAVDAPRRPPAGPKGQHPLVRGAKDDFLHAREPGYWVDHATLSGNAFLRPWKGRLVDILVSKAALDDALKLASNFFFALDAAGHAPALVTHRNGAVRKPPPLPKGFLYLEHVWWPDRSTVAFFGDTKIGFGIHEEMEQIDVEYRGNKVVRAKPLPKPSTSALVERDWTRSTRWEMTGRLAIRAYCAEPSVEWMQTWNVRPDLENLFREIIGAVKGAMPKIQEDHARAQRRAAEERQRREREHAEFERKELERKRRARDELLQRQTVESRRQLLGLAREWTEAKEIQKFLAEAEAMLDRLPEPERSEMARRVGVAREFIDARDAVALLEEWTEPPASDATE